MERFGKIADNYYSNVSDIEIFTLSKRQPMGYILLQLLTVFRLIAEDGKRGTTIQDGVKWNILTQKSLSGMNSGLISPVTMVEVKKLNTPFYLARYTEQD